jgi:hypothetical protein
MTDLVPVTTYVQRRQHLAEPASLWEGEGGLIGRPLCWNQTKSSCYDQGWVDEHRARWIGPNASRLLVSSLPACKRCERCASQLDGVS